MLALSEKKMLNFTRLVAGGFVVGVIYQILQPLPTYIQIDGRGISK